MMQGSVNDRALRIRKDGRVLCADHNPPEEGDLYLDDHIHEYLAWCSSVHPDTRQIDNYDWEKHEYLIAGRRNK